MLILVSISISIVLNTGLFSKAGQAVGDMDNAKTSDQSLSSGGVEIGGQTYNSIDEYLATNPGGSGGGTTLKSYDTANKGGTNGTLTENAIYTSGTDTATIPAGFKVSTVPAEQEISTGLVIQDSDGNEFVWIPVEVTAEDTETSIASFYRSYWFNNARAEDVDISNETMEPFYDEYYGSEGIEENTKYVEMIESVYIYHGFYIGRYEAGSETVRTTESELTPFIVKKDAYPYNFVQWGTQHRTELSEREAGAVQLSQQLYSSSTSVTSTLCYGIHWDAMLDFVKDTNNVTHSLSWGNYYDSTYTTTSSSKYSTDSGATWTSGSYEKSSSDNVLLTTGASEDFKAKNIYDIAGNVWEWTREAYTTGKRIIRGGCSYMSSGQAKDRQDTLTAHSIYAETWGSALHFI